MGASTWHDFVLRVLWYGGSTLDAWLNISSTKVGSRLVIMPQSAAQMGLPSATAYQLIQGGMGMWVQHLINVLYLKHKHQTSLVQSDPGNTRRTSFTITTQLHEVIGGLLGFRWGVASLLLNSFVVLYVASHQLVASSNLVYILNDKIDKRTWTSIFAGIFSLSIFIPSAHNFRVWSFIGVVTFAFLSGYLTTAALLHDKVENVTHTSPSSYQEYYNGLSGFTILGHVIIPVEIMDAMWKPKEYTPAYVCSTVFILLFTLLPSISMHRRFGDALLDQPNVLTLLPSSKFRDAAVVLLLMHLFINFGMYSLAAYAMWEKLLRVHGSRSYAKRTLSRVPVFMTFWIIALAFPFYGIFGKLVDTVLVVWNLYVIPCAAYNVVFWSENAHKHSKSYLRACSINVGIILWVVVVEFGLGLWGVVTSLVNQRVKLRLFARCFNC